MASQVEQTKDAVTLPKKEYLRLKEDAQAYRDLAARVFELPLKDPVAEVVADFKATGLYADDFITDLEDGLRQSSYSKTYANQSAKS